nr:PREDICTED: eukaryotic translation initiation factor 2-alpha kinase 1-like [Megachile rotundata]
MGDNAVTNPWDSLSTVTTFDRGNSARSTICLNNDTNQNNGQLVSIVTPSTSLLIESLIQQLCMLFEDDTARRNKLYFAICDRLHELKLIDSSYSMMEFETLRSQYQRALYHLVAVARAATGCESILQVPSSLMTEWSRYHREFQEISFIGAGGFGNVFKALHRLDGIEYAIKKIMVRSGRVKSIMQHLEEVKTLAKLNHTNIVSYKSAWIESTVPSTFVPSLVSPDHFQSKSSSLSHRRNSRCKSYRSQSSDTQNQLGPSGNYSDTTPKENGQQGDQLTQESIAEENIERNISNSISFRSDSKYQDRKTNNNTMDGTDSYEETSSNKQLYPYVPQMNEQYATLYIQMALCEKTLQQWLDERVEMTSQTMIIAILTQILCGLEYIHSRKIVHHDIKPSNIFISLSGRLQIQLGDFGLACPLQREDHHSILGTHMYAAPEQLQGKCDPKSDIYSLGIVLLELLIHTKTNMERIEVINGLKQGQIPTSVTANYPKWVHIVSQLVQTDPKKRPSTNQLLRDLNEDKDITIAQLRNDIAEKDDTINKLQERILLLEKQIAKCNIPIDDI